VIFAIKKSAGRTVKLTSDSPYLYMIPWKMIGENRTVKTFNPDIAKALAAILPAGIPFATKSGLTAAYCCPFWPNKFWMKSSPNGIV